MYNKHLKLVAFFCSGQKSTVLTCCVEFLFSLSQPRHTAECFHLIWASPLEPGTRMSVTSALVVTVRSVTRRCQCCNASQTSSRLHFSSSNLPPLYAFLSSHLFSLTKSFLSFPLPYFPPGLFSVTPQTCWLTYHLSSFFFFLYIFLFCSSPPHLLHHSLIPYLWFNCLPSFILLYLAFHLSAKISLFFFKLLSPLSPSGVSCPSVLIVFVISSKNLYLIFSAMPVHPPLPYLLNFTLSSCFAAAPFLWATSSYYRYFKATLASFSLSPLSCYPLLFFPLPYMPSSIVAVLWFVASFITIFPLLCLPSHHLSPLVPHSPSYSSSSLAFTRPLSLSLLHSTFLLQSLLPISSLCSSPFLPWMYICSWVTKLLWHTSRVCMRGRAPEKIGHLWVRVLISPPSLVRSQVKTFRTPWPWLCCRWHSPLIAPCPQIRSSSTSLFFFLPQSLLV